MATSHSLHRHKRKLPLPKRSYPHHCYHYLKPLMMLRLQQHLASERSSVASASTTIEKENSIVDDVSAASSRSAPTMIGNDNENNGGVNTNTNIQSQIPSMINSIPFP
jgi:hypothetical protein